MGRKAGTEVGVNSCLVPLIATESVSIALSWLLLPPEVGVNRHGLNEIASLICEGNPENEAILMD